MSMIQKKKQSKHGIGGLTMTENKLEITHADRTGGDCL